ncbi:MAG: methyltransferase domain-containing protein [Chitinophagales bacterium]
MNLRNNYFANYSDKIIRGYNLISFMVLYGKWSDLNFLNLGYTGNTLPFPLETQDEKDIHFISLYAKALEGLPDNTKSIIEIGSGLGGGCYLLKKYYKIPVVNGIDYGKLNVKYSNKKLNPLGITIFESAAEEAWKINKKYDVVLSLEASLLFYNWELFLKSVYSLLNEDGVFLYSDIFLKKDISVIENLLEKCGFVITFKEDITSGVKEAVKKSVIPDSETFSFKLIKKILGLDSLDKFITNKAGTEMYNKIMSDDFVYIKYIIHKKAN